jgi:hypothetical protein
MIRHQIHQLVDDLLDLHSSLTPCGRCPEARGHFRSARREVLLGLRAVLDGALHRIDKKEADDQYVRVPVEN